MTRCELDVHHCLVNVYARGRGGLSNVLFARVTQMSLSISPLTFLLLDIFDPLHCCSDEVRTKTWRDLRKDMEAAEDMEDMTRMLAAVPVVIFQSQVTNTL